MKDYEILRVTWSECGSGIWSGKGNGEWIGLVAIKMVLQRSLLVKARKIGEEVILDTPEEMGHIVLFVSIPALPING